LSHGTLVAAHCTRRSWCP